MHSQVGPGSGAISLALLKEWGGARAHAVELCEHAVVLTQLNAEVFGEQHYIIFF